MGHQKTQHLNFIREVHISLRHVYAAHYVSPYTCSRLEQRVHSGIVNYLLEVQLLV